MVEDEETISEPLAEGLEREGFAPEVAATLEAARDELTARIRAIMRRGKLSERHGAIEAGELHPTPASPESPEPGKSDD